MEGGSASPPNLGNHLLMDVTLCTETLSVDCRIGHDCPHTFSCMCFSLSAAGEGVFSTFDKVTSTVGIRPVAVSPITKDYPAVYGTRF